ncbi:MAG: hypothetical protein J6P87_09360 [Lachnospiraceae bacterium]|nr:hypothetical protein [Lachnospiraceae bacterium]
MSDSEERRREEARREVREELKKKRKRQIRVKAVLFFVVSFLLVISLGLVYMIHKYPEKVYELYSSVFEKDAAETIPGTEESPETEPGASEEPGTLPAGAEEGPGTEETAADAAEAEPEQEAGPETEENAAGEAQVSGEPGKTGQAGETGQPGTEEAGEEEPSGEGVLGATKVPSSRKDATKEDKEKESRSGEEEQQPSEEETGTEGPDESDLAEAGGVPEAERAEGPRPATVQRDETTPSPAAASAQGIRDLTDPDSWFDGMFELPVSGAAGFASVAMNITDSYGKIVGSLQQGEAFTINRDVGSLLTITKADGTSGYIPENLCMVNLPDILPSILYTDTNSDSSIFRSSGYDLPGITGQKLYNARYYNYRLRRIQYVMPVLYHMAEKVAAAQKAALSGGYTLNIYETYRPHPVQMKISDSLTVLMNENPTVERNVNKSPWNKGWFIAVSLSNHQIGCAMDVSLARIVQAETGDCGGYAYLNVTQYEECRMPTQMHEISSAACVFTTPVDSKSKTAWIGVELAPSMTEDAVTLQNICTGAGMSPLASEWWHFNDLDAKAENTGSLSYGQYYLPENLSSLPDVMGKTDYEADTFTD